MRGAAAVLLAGALTALLPAIVATSPEADRGGVARFALVAQTVVPVHEEPRHRLVFEQDDLRILDVRIEPGDTTLYHRHDAPILYVRIGESATASQTLGAEWRGGGGQAARPAPPSPPGRVSSVVSYVERPVSHRVTNVGDGLFRLIALLHRGDGDPGPPGSAAMPGDTELENRWFLTTRVTVDPGGWLDLFETQGTTVVVLGTRGVLRASVDDGGALLSGAGDHYVVAGGKPLGLRNAGHAAVTAVLVRLR